MATIIPFPKVGIVANNSGSGVWQGFYTLEAVSRLTLVPMPTLRRWRRDAIIGPSILVTGDRGEIEAEGYSYADVTIIRMIRALRRDRFDFHTAAVALWHLFERLGPPREWKDAHVYFAGSYVFAEQPDGWGTTEATHMGQATMPELFGDLFESLRQAEQVGDLLIPEQFRAFVTVDPDVMSGEPVVKGTRAPTALFIALKRKGHSLAKICRAYSMIPRKLIEQAIEYEEFVEKALGPTTQAQPA